MPENNYLQFGDKGKFGQVQQSSIKGGVKIEQIKDAKLQNIFKAVDDGDGVLDDKEIETFMNGLNPDENKDVITSKEVKEFLKTAQKNGTLQDIKKEDVFNFLTELSQLTGDIKKSQSGQDDNGNKFVVIEYNDGTVESLFPNNRKEITVSQNGVTVTKKYQDNKLTNEIRIETGTTTETEYAEDGETPLKQTITSSSDNSVKTIIYENKEPKTAQVKRGTVLENYIYQDGKEVLTDKIENEGIEAKETHITYTYDESGNIASTVSDDMTQTVETTYTDESIIVHATNKSDNTVLVSVTDMETGEGYSARYQNGMTYVTLQYGENINQLAKKFGVTAEKIADLNADNPDFNGGKVGAQILVPGELNPKDERLVKRNSAEVEIQKEQQAIEKQRQIDAQRAAKAAATERAAAARQELYNNTLAQEKSKKLMKDYSIPCSFLIYAGGLPDPNQRINTFEDVARFLYGEEGNTEVTETQIKARAAVLRELNPGINDGSFFTGQYDKNLYRPMNVRAGTAASDAKKAERTATTKVEVAYSSEARGYLYQNANPDGSVSLETFVRYLFRSEYGYDCSPTEIEVRERMDEVRALNPEIGDNLPYGTVLKVPIKRQSYLNGDYDRKQADAKGKERAERISVAANSGDQASVMNELAKITTKEDFYAWASHCKGGGKLTAAWEINIPAIHRDEVVMDWYRKGVLTKDELLNYQARKAARELVRVCEGPNIGNSRAISDALKLVTDPTGEKNNESAKYVKKRVDQLLDYYTSGSLQHFTSIEEYVRDEFSFASGEWYMFGSTSDEDNMRATFASNGIDEVVVWHDNKTNTNITEKLQVRDEISTAQKASEYQRRLIAEYGDETQAAYGIYNERRQATSIVRSLAEGIDRWSLSNYDIKGDLARISPSNVAYIYTEYRNKTGHSLAEDIDGELSLDIVHVKSTICKNLVTRAQQLNIDDIRTEDYQKINDINKLDTWITESIKKLDNATNKNVQIKNGKDFAQQGIESISINTTESGSTAVYYYTNGKVVNEVTNAKQGTVRTLQTSAISAQNVIHTPCDNATASPIEIQFIAENNNARQMALSLQSNKATLMSMLKFDNETYDNYAKLTMAIAERETAFGQYCLVYDEDKGEFIKDQDKYNTQKANAEDALKWSKWAKPYVDKKNPYMSFGFTGIKYDAIVAKSGVNNDEGKIYKQVLDDFAKMGITCPEDLYDPAKCAAATMIYAKAQTDLLNASIAADNKSNGDTNNHNDLEARIQACPGVDITEYDVVANAWNRGFSFIKDATMNPSEWEYNNSIRENMQKYTVVPK